MSLTPSRTDPSERPSIMQLAFPSILGNLLYSVVAMVQTKFVGELGPEAVAAVGAGQRVFFGLQAVMIAISAGTTALVARAWGAQEYDEAGRVTMASLVIAGAFGLALTVPGVLSPVSWRRCSGSTTARWRWPRQHPLAVGVQRRFRRQLHPGRRAAGRRGRLDAAVGRDRRQRDQHSAAVRFHLRALGFPAMGVGGAAVAAGLSFTAGGIVLLGLWRRQALVVKYIVAGWLTRDRLRQRVRIGYPAGAEMVVFQVGFFAFLMLIGNYYGTEAFAAYSVGANLLMFCMVVASGSRLRGRRWWDSTSGPTTSTPRWRADGARWGTRWRQ